MCGAHRPWGSQLPQKTGFSRKGWVLDHFQGVKEITPEVTVQDR